MCCIRGPIGASDLKNIVHVLQARVQNSQTRENEPPLIIKFAGGLIMVRQTDPECSHTPQIGSALHKSDFVSRSGDETTLLFQQN